jgi:hypothetical protein
MIATSQSRVTAAEDTAVKNFRAAGFHAIQVGSPARRDGEFVALLFEDRRGSAALIEAATRPRSHVEIQRIHAGRHDTRIYLRWTR